jgi:hypothetical protein
MGSNYGVWVNVSGRDKTEWIPLRGAVELHIGPVELTFTIETLEQFIAAAVRARNAAQEWSAAPVVKSEHSSGGTA